MASNKYDVLLALLHSGILDHNLWLMVCSSRDEGGLALYSGHLPLQARTQDSTDNAPAATDLSTLLATGLSIPASVPVATSDTTAHTTEGDLGAHLISAAATALSTPASVPVATSDTTAHTTEGDLGVHLVRATPAPSGSVSNRPSPSTDGPFPARGVFAPRLPRSAFIIPLLESDEEDDTTRQLDDFHVPGPLMFATDAPESCLPAHSSIPGSGLPARSSNLSVPIPEFTVTHPSSPSMSGGEEAIKKVSQPNNNNQACVPLLAGTEVPISGIPLAELSLQDCAPSTSALAVAVVEPPIPGPKLLTTEEIQHIITTSPPFTEEDYAEIRELRKCCPNSLFLHPNGKADMEARLKNCDPPCQLSRVCHRGKNCRVTATHGCKQRHDISATCPSIMAGNECTLKKEKTGKSSASCRFNHDTNVRLAVWVLRDQQHGGQFGWLMQFDSSTVASSVDG